MKPAILVILMSLSIFTLAQNAVEISQGESYSNDVFVSMAGGEIETVDALNWDISFNVVSGFSDGIRINDGQNAEMSIYPNGTIEDWDDIDTTGYFEWPKLNNGLEIWSGGALNQGYDESNPFDFGWGIYTGDPEHDVIGDSLYIMKLIDETFKKVRIDLLDGGSWTFTYADLNGDNEVSETFAMTDYPDRNYIYYSMTDQAFIDREPDVTTWDMVFTRYFGETSFGPGATAGVLTNSNVEIIEADGVDIENVNWGDYTFTIENISVIGNDWKFLNDMFMWEITPDRCYFVKDQLGDIYKLVFTSFEGSATGNIEYNAELVSGVGVENLFANNDVKVYPNPSNGSTEVIVDVTAISDKFTGLSIHDLNGRVLSNLDSTLYNNSDIIRVPIDGFSAGLYLINLQTQNGSISRKLIVE